MSFDIHTSGGVRAVVEATLPQLESALIASAVTDQDPTLWGDGVAADTRLGWVQAVSVSRPLLTQIAAVRAELLEAGLTRVVLAGTGDLTKAPTLIADTSGVELTVVDSTAPSQILAALDGDGPDGLTRTVLVVSSPGGATVETDAVLRTFAAAFDDLGLEVAAHIVVVTEPGSPLDGAAASAGYRVFHADPAVTEGFRALTAYGLVPSGLAGADIGHLLDEADASLLEVAIDSPHNPALVLAAALAGGSPRPGMVAIVSDGTHITGLEEWIEQLLAAATGKDGTGILPVVMLPVSPELEQPSADLRVLRLVDEAAQFHVFEHHQGEVLISGSLGAQFVVWQYVAVIVAHMLGVDPFTRPDLADTGAEIQQMLQDAPAPAAFVAGGVEVRAADTTLTASGTLAGTLDALWARLEPGGYVAVQAYVGPDALPELRGIRELVAADSGRPTTFGWGPGLLHSTGQYHRGGGRTGVFVQIVERTDTDVQIPGDPYTFSTLIAAQAAADAAALTSRGRLVVTLTLTDPSPEVLTLFEAAQ